MTQLIVIITYLALLLALGWSANRLFRGTANDYMLASHTIGPVLLLMSLFGTTMTAFTLVGSTGRSYTSGVGVYGMLASATGIVHSLCFFAIGVPLWAAGRRHNFKTQIQYLRARLESDLIGQLLFPILVLLVVSYLLLGVVAAGAVVNTITQGAFSFESQGWFADYGFGVPPWLASATICLVVLLYVFFGGMRGTAWANAFQTTVFMVLGVVTFFTIANAIGGQSSLWENLQIATGAVADDHLSRALIPEPAFFSFLLIPLSVAVFPHVFQHWLTARDAKTFKVPIVMQPIFIMIVWFPCVLLGTWSSSSLAGLDAGTPENQVLATMVQQHATPLLSGLLTAGILAAIMSSLDSQFLCVGTMFTEDVVLHGRSEDELGQARVVFLARCFVVGIVLLTFVLSLLLPRSVFDLGIWSFSGFTGFFPLVFACVYWRRLTAAGAVASVITTVACWFYMFWRADWGKGHYSFPEEPIALFGGWSIPPLMPIVSIFVASAIVLVAVSLLTRPPSQQTLAKFFDK